MALFGWPLGNRKKCDPPEEKKEETGDAVYWYNKGCEMLGVGAQRPQGKVVVVSRGGSYEESLQEALRCFDKALEMDLRYGDAWANKGAVLFFLGQYEEAMKCARKALVINPNLETTRKLIEKIKEATGAKG